MAGDLLGLDGLGTNRHALEAVALEDSQVCVVPLSRLESITTSVRELQREFHRIVSDEHVRDHQQMAMLSGTPSERKLAAFLHSLSQRHAELGFSSTSFVLRMSREELGVHLGLTLETISRGFSRLQALGLLKVHLREVTVLKPAELCQLAQGTLKKSG